MARFTPFADLAFSRTVTRPSFTRKALVTAMLAASMALAGCQGSSDDDDSSQDQQPADTSSYAMLDAATDVGQAAYLDLATGTQTAADQNWQVAYQKYVGFKTNGGSSGSGGVTACYTGNSAALYDSEGAPVQSEFEALNADNTLEAFNAVTSVESCGEEGLISDSIVTQVQDWILADHSQGAPIYTADSSKWWILRSATQDAATQAYAYARFHITDLSVEFGATTTRKLTLGVESWNSTTQSFDTEVSSPELDYTAGRVYYDLETNSQVTADDDWDLSVVVDGRNYLVQVNGGASGTGSAGIGVVQEATGSATDVTDPTNTDQVYKYFADQSSGAFSEPGDYGALDYNVDGQGHQMWPNYGIYLIQDGEQLYKMQVLSNYGQDGTLSSGNLYIRYAQITH